MEITTKFEIGQQVWLVRDRIDYEVEKCSICAGAGQVPVVGIGDLVKCPKCWGKGEMGTGAEFRRTTVSHSPMTVGKVSVEVEGPTYERDDRSGLDVDRSNMGPRSYKREERYMCVETGVGSGSLYYVKDLFATLEEAQAEAEARTQKSVEEILRWDEVPA